MGNTLSLMKRQNTPQEDFWAGQFGTEYTARNKGPQLLASKLSLFAHALSRAHDIRSCAELGCNIGLNLTALSCLLPGVRLCGVEINPDAAAAARDRLPEAEIVQGSVLDWECEQVWDLTFTCGVMIHINPELLPQLYGTLAKASRRYVLIAEYYNPSPVVVPYRGHSERLFKRDFAGEFLEANPDFRLLDYGFVWHRDPAFPLDDLTWFLLERGA